MKPGLKDALPLPDTEELRNALQRLLLDAGREDCQIVQIDRQASAYASSHPLEELGITCRDGQRLCLILKELDPRRLSMEVRCVKPAFLDEPRREIEVYRQLLSRFHLGCAKYYGAVVDEQASRFLLFLEKIEGRELYQVGEHEVWRQAVRWLADFHARFNDPEKNVPEVCPWLIRYDSAYYTNWLSRALEFGTNRQPCNKATVPDRLHRLAAIYPRVVEELCNLPLTLVHGEFYASNVIASQVGDATRICPIDWERAAIAPGPIDLAALTAGRWSEAQKLDFVREYWLTATRTSPDKTTFDTFVRAYYLCSMHLGVQWLGWFADWSPPRDHRQDWLAEAEHAARCLGYNLN